MNPNPWRDGAFTADMSDLIGRTFSKVEQIRSGELVLVCAEGTFRFFHEQGCCESVEIESIVGDLADLIGTPILLAEESVGESAEPEDWEKDEYTESYTWTFYKFATRKGYVDVRWFGSSNGYYGESVDLEFIKS